MDNEKEALTAQEMNMREAVEKEDLEKSC